MAPGLTLLYCAMVQGYGFATLTFAKWSTGYLVSYSSTKDHKRNGNGEVLKRYSMPPETTQGHQDSTDRETGPRFTPLLEQVE